MQWNQGKQQQLMGKGSIAGLMLCFIVSMLKARLSNCATDKMLQCVYRTFYLFHVWMENFCCIFAPKVAFSNLCGIVSTTHQSESTYLEIARLHQKGAIQPCHHEAGEFISPGLQDLRRMILFRWLWTWSLLIPMSLIIILKWTSGLLLGWWNLDVTWHP